MAPDMRSLIRITFMHGDKPYEASFRPVDGKWVLTCVQIMFRRARYPSWAKRAIYERSRMAPDQGPTEYIGRVMAAAYEALEREEPECRVSTK